MHSKNRKFHHTIGFHTVVLFEGAKGVLVLLAGFGLLMLINIMVVALLSIEVVTIILLLGAEIIAELECETSKLT